MTRVSTLSQNLFFLANTEAAQARLADLQRQLATGEKAEAFKDLGSRSLSLTAAQSRIARARQFMANNVHTKAKLDLRETAVREIADITKDLKAEFLQAEGVEDARQLQVYAENQLQRVVAILNSRDQTGNYMFGGSRTNIPPVAMTASGAPPPAFTFSFSNDQVVEQARIDENLAIDIGVLAGADATAPAAAFNDLFTVLNYFAAGRYPPPVAGTPQLPQPGVPSTVGAAAQVTALIDSALDAVNQLDADLGIKQKLLEEVDVTLQEEIDLTREFVGSVNDADLAELVTKISQEEVALEASFTITGELRTLSLVNFL
jgi:flagellar hook-associated protein 3 FlgL